MALLRGLRAPRAAVIAGIAGALLLPLLTASPAHAWWVRGGYGYGYGYGWRPYWRPPALVVAPPVVVAPAPVYAVPPPVVVVRPYWARGYWRGGYWVPGHWVR
jgi:hypothetical protein